MSQNAATSTATTETPTPFIRMLAVMPWLGQGLFAIVCLFFDSCPRHVKRHAVAALLTVLAFVALAFVVGVASGAFEASGGDVDDPAAVEFVSVGFVIVCVVNAVRAWRGKSPWLTRGS
ncbi:MAG: hypothetical protein ACRCSN_17970 [Dermatophilaceae bacterium]